MTGAQLVVVSARAVVVTYPGLTQGMVPVKVQRIMGRQLAENGLDQLKLLPDTLVLMPADGVDSVDFLANVALCIEELVNGEHLPATSRA